MLLTEKDIPIGSYIYEKGEFFEGITKCEYIKGSGGYRCISYNRRALDYVPFMFCTDVEERRFCTKEEEIWMEKCIEARKFISFDNLGEERRRTYATY